MVCVCVCTGDTGEGEEPTEGEVVRENDNIFNIWSSGRVNCIGMLVHMKVNVDLSFIACDLRLLCLQMCRRHDLFSVFTGLVTPEYDTIVSAQSALLLFDD